jgi:hypothetical protein
MAIDVLSVPASSANVERLFSSAKLIVTDRRNRIQVRTMEMLECLKSWRNIPTFELTGQWETEKESIEDIEHLLEWNQ